MFCVAGEKPYSCKFEGCDRAFAQLSNLQHHMRNHEDQVKKEASRVHKCLVCHRSYTNESSLKAHTLKVSVGIVYHVAVATRRNSKESVFWVLVTWISHMGQQQQQPKKASKQLVAMQLIDAGLGWVSHASLQFVLVADSSTSLETVKVPPKVIHLIFVRVSMPDVLAVLSWAGHVSDFLECCYGS